MGNGCRTAINCHSDRCCSSFPPSSLPASFPSFLPSCFACFACLCAQAASRRQAGLAGQGRAPWMRAGAGLCSSAPAPWVLQRHLPEPPLVPPRWEASARITCSWATAPHTAPLRASGHTTVGIEPSPLLWLHEQCKPNGPMPVASSGLPFPSPWAGPHSPCFSPPPHPAPLSPLAHQCTPLGLDWAVSSQGSSHQVSPPRLYSLHFSGSEAQAAWSPPDAHDWRDAGGVLPRWRTPEAAVSGRHTPRPWILQGNHRGNRAKSTIAVSQALLSCIDPGPWALTLGRCVRLSFCPRLLLRPGCLVPGEWAMG